jgi:hypothetical protein
MSWRRIARTLGTSDTRIRQLVLASTGGIDPAEEAACAATEIYARGTEMPPGEAEGIAIPSRGPDSESTEFNRDLRQDNLNVPDGSEAA